MRPLQCQYELNRRKLESLEKELRDKALIHQPTVQSLLQQAYKTWNEHIFDLALSRLSLILQTNNTHEMRTTDAFRPYCPLALSRSGKLHLLNQMDHIPIYIDPNKLVTGLGVFGPQGGGKSRQIIHLCQELRHVAPDVTTTYINPKGDLCNLAGFVQLDLSNLSFDKMPSVNVNINPFAYEAMPILSNTAGLIYALELLYEALDITLAQRQHYINQTGTDPGLCLQDIYLALKSIKVSSPRRAGYHDAAVTALALILGKQNLFSCRKGISLDWLFSNNVVINARSLTDEMQCRFFVIYLLYWLYQRARNTSETHQLKHILIIDDATRFIGTTGTAFDGHTKTSPLGHLLAVLRSSGICLIYATQLPAQVDPSVLSLTRNILVVGNMSGNEHLRVIQNMMSLTDAQVFSIPAFKTRQTLAFISGSDWPYPIHGWTPNVELNQFNTPNPQPAQINIIPWHPLTEIPQQPAPTVQNVSPASTPHSSPQTAVSKPAVSSDLDRLIYDCIAYPFDKVRDRVKRIGFSVRSYDTAKNEAIQNGSLISSLASRSLYLIPTQAAFDRFGIVNPYTRATSIEHAFYVQMAAHILKHNSDLKVQTETPIGTKGATIDVTAVDPSGNMTAVEVTLSTSNLASNASKLQATAYTSIIWLCRDEKTAKAVKAFFNKTSSLPPELLAKFKYMSFRKRKII
ncbi:MAG: hypothetical protein ABFD91_08070 [Anaerohalosphaeraceae bacterium]